MSNPVPGLPSGMSWVRVWVFSLGYPFATQDTERNSSDECARDPRRTSHDLRRTNLASQIVRRYKRGNTHTIPALPQM